jgi:uncharacterized protein (TIGR03435 family)
MPPTTARPFVPPPLSPRTSSRNFANTLSSAVTCVAITLTASATGQSPSSSPDLNTRIPNFAVSWVKPTGVKDGRWRLAPTADGWSALDVSVLQMVKEAYAIDQDDRIQGAPSWLSTEKFDFEAKVDDADIRAFQALHFEQECVMLQRLLADRFSLALHFETRQLPLYVLTVAKGGPKMHESPPDPNDPIIQHGMGGLIRKSNGHQWAVEKETMPALARFLTLVLGNPVVDQTGLTGRYDFELDWAPDASLNMSAANNSPPPTPAVPAGPSIFTAVKDQLGLRLESQKGPVQVLVIDHVAQPSPN